MMIETNAKQLENMIQENAALAVEEMRAISGIPFGYDTASVTWLDDYINHIRVQDEITPEIVEEVEAFVNMFACFLGECVIRAYGGKWAYHNSELGIQFASKNYVFPFAKVEKQFAYGAEESISSFFTLIPLMFTRHDNPAAAWEEHAANTETIAAILETVQESGERGGIGNIIVDARELAATRAEAEMALKHIGTELPFTDFIARGTIKEVWVMGSEAGVNFDIKRMYPLMENIC